MPESTELTASAAILAPSDRRAQILAGITDSFSAALGIFPFGIALGLLVMQLGLPWWVAPALSLSAFAGSLELLLVGMIASVEPLAAVAVTVFVVNFRHVFYAFSFPRHLVRNASPLEQPPSSAWSTCCKSPSRTSRLVLAVHPFLQHVHRPGMIRMMTGLSRA